MLLAELVESVWLCAQGNVRGRCVVCGRLHAAGFAPDFSEKFTSYQFLQAFEDGCLCAACYEMLTNPQWRRSHWVACATGVRWLKREEVRQLLDCPPEPPFALYTTNTFKKHGWLCLQQHVNLSRTELRWGWDEQVFVMEMQQLREMIGFAEQLRARGWKVGELLSRWEIHHIAAEPGAYELWKDYRREPAWQWVVWISRPAVAEQLALPSC